MDFYLTAETALLTLLKDGLPSFFPNPDEQVTASDDSVLDNGNDFYCISYPGAFPQTEEASGFVVYNMEILLDVISRWDESEDDAWNENGFKAFRSAIINLINHTKDGKLLGNTSYVQNALISAEDRPSYIPVRGTDPNNVTYSHIRQVCVVTVQILVPVETV